MKTRAVFIFLVALAFLRCGWVALQDVSPHEAYYWLCSERLAPAFFDGPPGTAFMVRALDVLGGAPLYVAKWVWPFLGLGVGWLAWLLARRMYDETVACWVVIALNALPVFNKEAVVIGPAMPALGLVLAGILTARSAWNGRRSFWLLAGGLFALAAIFRYDAILVPIGITLAGLLKARYGKQIDIFAFVSVVCLIVLALWAPLKWNASLEWIPIAGGTFQTIWEFRLYEFFIQIGLFLRNFSLIGIALVMGIVWMFRDARLHGRARFLLAVCAPVWVWWLYFSLRGEDATFVALLGSVPLMSFILSECRKFPRAPIFASFFIMISLISSGIMLWKNSREFSVWPQVANEIRETSSGLAFKDNFLIAETPDLAAVLEFYLEGKQNHVFVPESPDISSQFAIWPSYADFIESNEVTDEYFTEQRGVNPFIGRSALYVGFELPQTIKGAFGEVVALRRIKFPGARDLIVYLCLNYQTLPL